MTEPTQEQKLAEIKAVLGTETATHEITEYMKIRVGVLTTYRIRYTAPGFEFVLNTNSDEIEFESTPASFRGSPIDFIHSILDHVWRDASKVKPPIGERIVAVWEYEGGSTSIESHVMGMAEPEDGTLKWWHPLSVPSWMLEEKGAQS